MRKQVKNSELLQAREAVLVAGLYIANKDDAEKLAEIAMDAYENYPLHNWLTNGHYDRNASKRIMEICIKTMLNHGVIYADSKELNGFAIWMPAGFTGSKTIPFLLKGGIGLLFSSGPKVIRKLMVYEKYAMGLKSKCTEHKDWYLYNLTVISKAQGKGIASKLLYPMLNFCDAKKRICYLETNKEINVSVYKHFGFELKEQGLVPGSNVTHYAMMRYPKDTK